MHVGRTLFTLRNGHIRDPRYPKTYAEKLILDPEGQRAPAHFHRTKREDIINRGGMKISPAELDVALEQHPQLLEAAVCAYPDERLGEKICACLVARPGSALPSLLSLQDYLQQQGFARFKLPERIEVFEQLPRNALGKVQRYTLQDTVTARPEKQPS